VTESYATLSLPSPSLSISIKKFSYPSSNIPLFQDLSFELMGGQWTALIGKSGVGKSTILRIMASLENMDEFSGAIHSIPEQLSLKNLISYMPQQDSLLPWLDILSNIILGDRLRNQIPDLKRARFIIEEVGLHYFAHYKPGQLSGGMRQRVSLARILYEQKPIILMDEPFSGLDTITRLQTQDFTWKHLKNHTVLLITHDPAEAIRLCNTIYMMSGNPTHIQKVLTLPPKKTPLPVNDPLVIEQMQRLLERILEES